MVATIGYVAFGFGVLDAVYQTVTTISTVGFREVQPLTDAEKIFTIAVIVVGVATALYTFSALLESLIEGEIAQLLGRRRMDRSIAGMKDHLIVCGYGRVGREVARYACEQGADVVVVERDPDRCAKVEGCPVVEGDATEEKTLTTVGIDRARALIAAVNADADNLYITLTARGMKSDLFIISRARVEGSEAKMRQAGADRVVNPQRLGGARMAAFALEPHVAEFFDVIMHERTLDYRLAEITVPELSPLAGQTIRDAHIRDRTGALVLALRKRGSTLDPNPSPETGIDAGDVVIAIGTHEQLQALRQAAATT